MKEYQSKTFDEFCKDECPYDFQSCMPPDDCPFMEEDDDFEDDDYEDDNYDDENVEYYVICKKCFKHLEKEETRFVEKICKLEAKIKELRKELKP